MCHLFSMIKEHSGGGGSVRHWPNTTKLDGPKSDETAGYNQ